MIRLLPQPQGFFLLSFVFRLIMYCPVLFFHLICSRRLLPGYLLIVIWYRSGSGRATAVTHSSLMYDLLSSSHKKKNINEKEACIHSSFVHPMTCPVFLLYTVRWYVFLGNFSGVCVCACVYEILCAFQDGERTIQVLYTSYLYVRVCPDM